MDDNPDTIKQRQRYNCLREIYAILSLAEMELDNAVMLALDYLVGIYMFAADNDPVKTAELLESDFLPRLQNTIAYIRENPQSAISAIEAHPQITLH